MMRKCHLNTCPVGIATQDPVLRARFTGTARACDQLLLLRRRGAARDHGGAWRAHDRRDDRPRRPARRAPRGRSLEGEGRRSRPPAPCPRSTEAIARWNCERQDHGLGDALDHDLIAASKPALDSGEPARIERAGQQRQPRGRRDAVGRGRSPLRPCRPARRHASRVRLTGTAGQSFGAFLAHGVTLDLTGDANDYVGKGLSGGRVIVRQPERVDRDPAAEHHRRQHRPLWRDRRRGLFRRRRRRALRGPQFRRGRGGRGRRRPWLRIYDRRRRRWCSAQVGRNFAAGMSGGIAYVYDPEGGSRRVQPGQRRAGAVSRSGERDDPRAPRQRAPASTISAWAICFASTPSAFAS